MTALGHDPIMVKEILHLFQDSPAVHFLDCTFGRGGHSRAILEAFQHAQLDAMDRDPQAMNSAGESMRAYGPRFTCVQARFSHFPEHFQQKKYSGILLDLGMSSPQIEDATRGFSFCHPGPLDMRMSLEGQSAADLINTVSETDLANLIFRYGEEPKSRRIARAIVRARPLYTTTQLQEVVCRALPGRGKRHPATLTFQALRIAVNEELQELETVLPLALNALAPGGCLAILSFHSLEDRRVKHFLKSSLTSSLTLERIPKKPLRPLPEELSHNPRARSAKLRFAFRTQER
jgi:16S rRNA (cytosine1402-N4)-methyltransferase